MDKLLHLLFTVGGVLTIHALTAVEIGTWMSNYATQFYMDVIIYQCPNHDNGLGNLWGERTKCFMGF